jgi:hypothetical protein
MDVIFMRSSNQTQLNAVQQLAKEREDCVMRCYIYRSVADPGRLSRIPDPGSEFFYPGSELFPSRIRIEEFT